MNFEIIFTTTNPGKVQEANRLLQSENIKVFSLNNFNDLNLPQIPETGITFKENAQIKARGYFNLLKKPLIADDSGLVVPALNNEPGVLSARYSGKNSTTKKNNALLLKKMNHLKGSERNAYFQCALVYKDEFIEMLFEGKCYGRITENPKGEKGFGYDPLFYIPELNKTFAELSVPEKNKISHRGMAFIALKDFLKKRV